MDASPLAGWCHKRAFVTLGHNSLHSACLGVGHKGMVQYSQLEGGLYPRPTATSAPAAQGLRTVGQRPGKPTPAVAGRRPAAFSHISGRRRLWDLRNQQPAGLAFSGLPNWAGRHLGCGVHRPHRGRWLDTMGNIHDLQRRGVRIRSLAYNEQSWGQYLDADPDSPESFLGYTLAGFLLGCPIRSWCRSAAVPRRVWKRRGRTAGNWALTAGCRRSRRQRSSRWWSAESASGALLGPSGFRLRLSGVP